MRCGFAENKEKAVLRGEEAVIAFFATELPRLKKDWQVQEGERFQYVTRDLVRIEPQFAIREQSDGWLDFHVHYTAARRRSFLPPTFNQLLRSGRGHVRLKDGRVAVADAALASDSRKSCATAILDRNIGFIESLQAVAAIWKPASRIGKAWQRRKLATPQARNSGL